MTFLELYTGIPDIVEAGKHQIKMALAHLEKIVNDESQSEKDRGEAYQAIQSGMARLTKIDEMTRRLQQGVHLIALHCHDNSIPVPEVTEKPEGTSAVQH